MNHRCVLGVRWIKPITVSLLKARRACTGTLLFKWVNSFLLRKRTLYVSVFVTSRVYACCEHVYEGASSIWINLNSRKTLRRWLQTRCLLVHGVIAFCCFSSRSTMRLTTPHFRTNAPVSAQMGASTFAAYITWPLGVKLRRLEISHDRFAALGVRQGL